MANPDLQFLYKGEDTLKMLFYLLLVALQFLH